MIQEQKNLLLKDLCSRLPYGVFINFNSIRGTLHNIYVYHFYDGNDKIYKLEGHIDIWGDSSLINVEKVKPYLFPLSSMTEEERNEYKHFVAFSGNPTGSANFIDWLNAHHFDYRGLIPMGLAIDATGLNIY